MRKLLTVILVLLLIGCSIFVFKSFHKTSGVRDTGSDADGRSAKLTLHYGGDKSGKRVKIGKYIAIPSYSVAGEGAGKDGNGGRVEISAKPTSNKSLKRELEPTITGNSDRGVSQKAPKIKFKYAGEYKVEYKLKGEDSSILDSKTVYVKALPDKKLKTRGVAICMYHYVYPSGKKDAGVNANFISTGDLEAELKYLKKNHYYYPTWKEMREYVDGKLVLPDKSIVITFDDGAKSFFKYGKPLLEKHRIPATSFLITSKGGKKLVEKYSSDYIQYQSHTHDMHRPGGRIGHGGVMTALTEKEVVDDLKRSQRICGNTEALAYPFGDVTGKTERYVRKAGFICAVTTAYGKVRPGDSPMALNRIRMSEGQSLKAFADAVN